MKTSSHHRIWDTPWAYSEGILIAIGILICSIGLESVSRFRIGAFSYPVNIVFCSVFILFIVLIYLFGKKTVAVKWLSGIPASVSSIALFGLLSILMAIIPQNDNVNKFFVFHLTSTWVYLFSVLFLLLTLGIVTLKRLANFKIKRDIGFVLNHLGLWIILFATTFGAPDIHRYNMELHENETVWTAYNNKNEAIEMPFAIKLNKFLMEEFRPRVSIINSKTGDIITYQGKTATFDIQDSFSINILNYKIHLKTYYQQSGKIENKYVEVHDYQTAPSAEFEIISKGKSQSGWISCGNYLIQPEAFTFDSVFTLVMNKPEPKSYVSDVTIYSKDGKIENKTIKVNGSLTVLGYRIYQIGFDNDKGKFSTTSVVEAIYDPWINIIYIGCFILILGSIYLIFMGKPKNTTKINVG